MYHLFSKKSRIKRKIVELLVGNNTEFTIDHQMLMASILLTILICLITIPSNIIIGLPIIVALIHVGFIIALGTLYILARVFKIRKKIPTILILIVFIGLSINWFPNGGLQGCIPYYYLTLSGYIIYLTKGRDQIILLSLFIINISTLFYLEYFYPEIVIPYNSRETQFADILISFIVLLFFLAFLINVSKRLYHQEKKNSIDVINQYRKNSTDLKEKYNQVIDCLSLRERSVFEKIIQGKSNKEIAKELFIDEGTVKNHITNIYKKLEVNKRIELINKMNKLRKNIS